MSHHWPPFELTLRTPRLELRLPTDDEIGAMVDQLLEHRIHGEEEIPFTTAWALADRDELPTSFLQFHWSQRANWKPESWNWVAFAFIEGQPVGCQSIGARDFAAIRSVSSGSWLLPHYQGQGLGQHMRAAVLTLAFDHLEALEAHSGARVGNSPSMGVSYRLGYEDNGIARMSFGGQIAEEHRLRLTAERWQQHRPDIEIDVTGLDACRHHFVPTD